MLMLDIYNVDTPSWTEVTVVTVVTVVVHQLVFSKQ